MSGQNVHEILDLNKDSSHSLIISDPLPSHYYDTSKVYEIFEVSQRALFLNNQDDLDVFIDSAIAYPKKALDACVTGFISLEFVVERDGTLSQLKITSNELGYGLEEEAIRLIHLTDGHWTPAVLNNQKVRMRMRLPISFDFF